jgi:hypothetical protein
MIPRKSTIFVNLFSLLSKHRTIISQPMQIPVRQIAENLLFTLTPNAVITAAVLRRYWWRGGP